MENLSDLWIDACKEIWYLSEARPYMREATLWEAFKFMYMKRINDKGKIGRWVYGEVK